MSLLGYNEYKSPEYSNTDSGKQDWGQFWECDTVETEGLGLLI